MEGIQSFSSSKGKLSFQSNGCVLDTDSGSVEHGKALVMQSAQGGFFDQNWTAIGPLLSTAEVLPMALGRPIPLVFDSQVR